MQPRTAPFAALVIMASLAAGYAGAALYEGLAGAEPDALEGAARPTGRTVRIAMGVADVRQDIWPGFTASMWAFCASGDGVVGPGCSVPGPQIRVAQGDRVVVTLRNNHSFPHTIHWHGMPVPWRMDGVPGVTQDTVEPNATYIYDFVATKAGTMMYHCHVDETHHISMGLYGTLVVDPARPTDPPYDRDYSLHFATGNRTALAAAPDATDPHAAHGGAAMGRSGTPGQRNPPFEGTMDVFLINGRSFPLTLDDPASLVRVREGERVRLRLQNMGVDAVPLHLHGHDFTVTHRDGNLLPKDARWRGNTLSMAPGETYDVLFVADNPGKWLLHAHDTGMAANGGQAPGGMTTEVVYEGFESASFRGELPGGMPYAGPPPPPPPDHQARERRDVTGTAYEETFVFPVDATAAPTYRIGLRLLPLLNVAGSTAMLEATVRSPSGMTVVTGEATPLAPAWAFAADRPGEGGDYAVVVRGRGGQASYELTLEVRYPAASDKA